MFHLTTCPTCQTKFTIPEAHVGRTQTCPHCQSPFVAGKTVPDPKGSSGGPQPKAEPSFNKTMVADIEPSIRFNCPRCKKTMEVPRSEAGTKRPCPSCNQRLQVPAAPPAQAPRPGFDKTMLADDGSKPQATGPDPSLNKTMLTETAAPPIQFNCPRCQKPIKVPASEAGTKQNCPSCSQRLQVPVAPPSSAQKSGFDKTMLASDGVSSPPPGRDPSLNKTMLTETAPPICFDCPRCKKPLEVPSHEAGTKRPCPSCGQRLQVPAKSTKAATAAGIQTQPAPNMPFGSTVPSSHAAAGQAPTPSGQPGQAALPFNMSPKTLMIAGIAGGVFLLLILLLFLAPSHNRAEYLVAKKEAEELKKKLAELEQKQAQMKEEQLKAEKLKLEIEMKRAKEELELQKVLQSQVHLKNLEERLAQNEAEYLKIKNEDLRLQKLAKLEADKLAFKKQQAEIEALKKQAEYDVQKAKAEEERIRKEQEDREERKMMMQLQMQQSNAALQAAIINSNRPQYYPWHPYRYFPW